MEFWKQQRILHKELSAIKEQHQPTSLLTYKSLAEQAYSKRPSKNIGEDWNLILKSNNNKIYQNRQTGEVVNSISGSKSIKDFTNDALQYLGWLSNPLQKKRYDESADIIDRLNSIQKRREITTTSHSLGSNVANRLITDDKVDKAINFNAFVPDKSLNIDDSRVINVRNENDFASKLTRNNANTINLKNTSGPIKSHFLSNIVLE